MTTPGKNLTPLEPLFELRRGQALAMPRRLTRLYGHLSLPVKLAKSALGNIE